jgi:anti-sigma factor RsiW
MSTGCGFYADALVDLAAGRLEAGRVEQIETHLEGCRDCRAALEVIREVQASPAPMPAGLEARIQGAVRGDAATPTPVIGLDPRAGRWRGWRPWALPLAAAAAAAIWLGGSELVSGPSEEPTAAAEEVDADYDPYGAWPGSNGVVAGDLVLSELTVEELEALLEEMNS